MKGFVLILLFSSSLLLIPTKRTRDDLSCAQLEELKTDCGWFGITQEECEARNCCVAEPKIEGKPWCFYGIDDIPTYITRFSEKSCSIDRENRNDCGYFGIQKEECESRDCCFKIDEYESSVPWCFYGYEATPTTEILDSFSYVESGE